MSLTGDVRGAYCACDASEGNHAQFCVETLKPRIVAALEAAEDLVHAVIEDGEHIDEDSVNPVWLDFVAAMKGER